MNIVSLPPENPDLDVNKVPPLACIFYLSSTFLLFDVEEVHVLYMDPAFHVNAVTSREEENEPVYKPMGDDPIHEMTTLKTRAELRGGELCSTPQLSQSLLRSRAAASLHAGGGDSVKAGPEGEESPTREEEEEEEGEKMQAKPANLPIEMSYKSQEQQYMNVGLAQPDTEEHTKLQANPAYMPIEMMS